MSWWPFSSSTEDKTQNLDRDLKQFLESEARIQQQKDEEIKRKEAAKPPPKPLVQQLEESTSKEPAALPLEFKDGRYAHLWKTYQPPDSIATMSTNEKIKEMKDRTFDRDATVKYVASENCALEAEAEGDCFNRMGFREKMTMCRKESRALERCLMLQVKFLRALGYMSVPGRSAAEEERVQMHADSLYQEMLKHEESVAKAKKEGMPPPEFRPIMSRENMTKVLGIGAAKINKAVDIEAEALKAGLDPVKIAAMRDQAKEKLENQWKLYTPEERAAAEADLISRIREQSEMGQEFTNEFLKKLSDRQERKEAGKETLADKLHYYWEGERKPKQ
jgi:hypothetical protein